MAHPIEHNAPWSLRIDRDGTEDIAVIFDAKGEVLACSHHFWMPEKNDPIPPTLAAIQLMVTAPKLLVAAKATLTALELMRKTENPRAYTQMEWATVPLIAFGRAIAEAENIDGVAPASTDNS